jgi:Rieske Fe-S protein
VLRAVAVTGAGAAVLAACGGGSDDTVGTGGGTASSTPPGADSSSAAGTGSGGAGGGGRLVATADVPVKGGVVLDGKKIVVTQPTAGEFKAFTAVCTHQQCIVSSVKDNTITCPCHGSTYSATDGSVKGGPATAPLKSVAVDVEGDEVVQA